MNWKSLSKKTTINIEQQLQQIINSRQNYDLEFSIGCDSQFHKSKKKNIYKVVFVTALSVRFLTPGQIWKTDQQRRDRVGHGAMCFYTKQIEHVNLNYPVEVRLTAEVGKAIEHAQFIDRIIQPLGHKIYDIHIDLNPDKIYLSNRVLNGCSGWVKGMGYCPVCKPDSYVSSKIADKHVR